MIGPLSRCVLKRETRGFHLREKIHPIKSEKRLVTLANPPHSCFHLLSYPRAALCVRLNVRVRAFIACHLGPLMPIRGIPHFKMTGATMPKPFRLSSKITPPRISIN